MEKKDAFSPVMALIVVLSVILSAAALTEAVAAKTRANIKIAGNSQRNFRILASYSPLMVKTPNTVRQNGL